jgi:hypothetical protein
MKGQANGSPEYSTDSPIEKPDLRRHQLLIPSTFISQNNKNTLRAQQRKAIASYRITREGENPFSIVDSENKSNISESTVYHVKRTAVEALNDLVKKAASKASDPEQQKVCIQKELDKIIGIGEGLNAGKENWKASAASALKALQDGTVARFLARPNAINDELYKVISNTVESISRLGKHPEELENLGAAILESGRRYSALPAREQGRVSGEWIFNMVNPENIAEAGAAYKVIQELTPKLAREMTQEVTQEVAQEATHTAAQEIAQKTSHDAAQEVAKEVAQKVALEVPLEKTQEGAEKIATNIATNIAKGENLALPTSSYLTSDLIDRSCKTYENKMLFGAKALLSGVGGRWEKIGEMPCALAVRQSNKFSCVSAVGEMLSNGAIDQANLIDRLGEPANIKNLAPELGANWSGNYVRGKTSLDAVLKRGRFAAELFDEFDGKRLGLGHAVLVERLAPSGNLIIIDPAEATTYEMTRENFIAHWSGGCVYSNQIRR